MTDMTDNPIYVLVDDEGYGWEWPIQARDDTQAIDAARRHLAEQTIEPEDWSWPVRIDVWRLRRPVGPDGEHNGELVDSLIRVIDPPEPACPLGTHAWLQVRISGHGGGVVIDDACPCGVTRITDTWHTGPGGEPFCALRYERREPDVAEQPAVGDLIRADKEQGGRWTETTA